MMFEKTIYFPSTVGCFFSGRGSIEENAGALRPWIETGVITAIVSLFIVLGVRAELPRLLGHSRVWYYFDMLNHVKHL